MLYKIYNYINVYMYRDIYYKKAKILSQSILFIYYIDLCIIYLLLYMLHLYITY